MPVHENVELQRDTYVSSEEILERISINGELQAVPGPQGNGPARYFAFPGAMGAVGVISPLSHDYCDRCNRVRLDGRRPPATLPFRRPCARSANPFAGRCKHRRACRSFALVYAD